jgi:Ni/Fe-hydrogenase 1 B-type cytochrome subunit
MLTKSFTFKRVYLWELPVRIFHWTTVFTTITLIITGFIIANPPAINSNLEASSSYWFGYVRMIHFIAAMILVANVFFRIYWSFVGNKFAHWRNFIPLSKKSWKNIWYVLKVDIFLMKDKEHKLSNISIGHNYLAAFSYFIMTLLFIFQVMTGFALLSETSSWWLPKSFGWVLNMCGGDIFTRYLHHFSTWMFMAFIAFHVYLVMYHDYLEARGETSAMISGYKFVRSERIAKENEDFNPDTKA